MSQQLAICLIAVAVNLVGMFFVYSAMSHVLARFAWRDRGILAVIGLIVASQLFWVLPALLVVVPRDSDGASSYALWFGNWLVSGFGIVLLYQRAKGISRQLEDSSRMDGLGAFATWWHVVFPFVRREVGFLELFTAMATLLPFWGFITEPEAGNPIVLFQRFLSPQGRVLLMLAGSLIGALPLIGIFFATRTRA